MFTLTGIRNILFDARLRNPTQLTFCPKQFASEKVHNFHFFFCTLSEGLIRAIQRSIDILKTVTEC